MTRVMWFDLGNGQCCVFRILEWNKKFQVWQEKCFYYTKAIVVIRRERERGRQWKRRREPHEWMRFIGSWENILMFIFTHGQNKTKQQLVGLCCVVMRVWTLRFDHRWKWNNTAQWREKDRERIADSLSLPLCLCVACASCCCFTSGAEDSVYVKQSEWERESAKKLTQLLFASLGSLWPSIAIHLLLHPFCFYLPLRMAHMQLLTDLFFWYLSTLTITFNGSTTLLGFCRIALIHGMGVFRFSLSNFVNWVSLIFLWIYFFIMLDFMDFFFF